MNRNNFLFKKSARLYQQSESLANFLLKAFVEDTSPFQETLNVLQKAGILGMVDMADRKKATDIAWKHLLAISSTLDSRSVIPGLLTTIELYYYGYSSNHIKQVAPWLGTAMKTAVAVAWSHRSNVNARFKSQSQVRRLVAAAGAWEQLMLHCDQARAFEFGRSEFFSAGVLLNEKDIEIREAWNKFSSKRGLALRTLQNCFDVIWHSPKSFLSSVSDVLAGEKPSRIPLLQGTVFEEIQTTPEFWLGLSARLQLLAHAATFRRIDIDKNLTGISIFEPFAVASQFLGIESARAKTAVQAMFWQPQWHVQRLERRDYISNMLVERPAIRIDDQTFVVAMTNMGDSINCFVEHSIFRHIGYGGVPVSEEAFRRHVSQLFEDQVIATFIQYGWKADHVSEKGVWTGIPLSHISGNQIPGEVDVLAVHPSNQLVILIECKVLSSPFTSNKLFNVMQKLGSADSESFHRKLNEKAAWIGETDVLRGIELIQLLVVDEGAFIGKNAPNLVIDMENLPSLIDNCEQQLKNRVRGATSISVPVQND